MEHSSKKALESLIVFTEGKTDWRHLKKSSQVLGIATNILFHEADNSGGDQNLFQRCQHYAEIPQNNPLIFLFDHDNRDIIRKVTEDGKRYKMWGNNVFSLVLPKPAFRSEQENVCIEMLFDDATLSRSDAKGRRLFMTSEFDQVSGNLKSDATVHVGNVNKIHNSADRRQMKIIDSDIGVFNTKDKNIAMSKADFAEAIANGEIANVNFEGFRELLILLETIVSTSREVIIPVKSGKNREDTKVPVNVEGKHIAESRDQPPYLAIFVGREINLRVLDNPKLRVAAITGLGGEGKSSLASRFFDKARRQETDVRFLRTCWCDCKELSGTFHERLLFLLEELSDGKETQEKYFDEPIPSTNVRFVQHLLNKDTLVVFDNVDAFVDKDAATFVGTLRNLFDAITSRLSRSLVVFTCRPAIHDYHPSFLEVPITGLSLEECHRLSENLEIKLSEGRNALQ